jgi:integrase
MFFRHATGQRKTKKRQPPVRLTPRLLAHMRRWGRLGIARHAVIEWNGKPVKSVRKSFTAAVIAAGLDPKEVTPHVLRHTAATWMVQRGIKLARAAEYLGMTEEVLRTTYYHESPDYQAETAAAIDKRLARL